MAEILNQWPDITRVRTSRYPWDTWTDGQIRSVKEGEDFTSSLKTFVQGLYAYGKRHDLKVEVRTAPAEGLVAFRFIADQSVVGPEAAPAADVPPAEAPVAEAAPQV